jgi:hypothetical protein
MDIRKKYGDLSDKAVVRTENLRLEMKAAREVSKRNEASWEEVAVYEEIKLEYLVSKRIAQIYGRICADLGASYN